MGHREKPETKTKISNLMEETGWFNIDEMT